MVGIMIGARKDLDALVWPFSLACLVGSFLCGHLIIWKQRQRASKLVREGQLIIGVATYRSPSAAGELDISMNRSFSTIHYSVVFAVGFVRHVAYVPFPEPPHANEPRFVLFDPGGRNVLAFDQCGRGYAGPATRL